MRYGRTAAVIDQRSKAGTARNIAELKVLVVEDEALVAMLLEDMLLDMGCGQVELVSHLEDGLHAVENGTFGLAVLDVNLDGKRSFPIADRLMADGVPIVFATGYGAEGLEYPYSDIRTLQKPFFFEDLQSAVWDALARLD